MLASAVDFDLIFVDYMMTDLNGVDTIAQLRERNVNTHVIFFSSFPEVVFDTFSVNAFRFLIKPVEYPKFEEAMHAYFRDIEQYKTIVISNNHNSIVYNVPEDEIIYAQADNVYTQVFTVREAYTYTGTLSAFEKLLSEGMFFRTHRSYVVNIRNLELFTK